MKKYLSFILALIMILSFSACKDDDDSPTLEGTTNNTSQGGTQTPAGKDLSQFRGKLLEPTIQLIASGNYMYEAKTTSEAAPITYATVGGRSLITYTNAQNVPVTYINMDNKFYIVSSADSAYGEITPAVAARYNISLDDLGTVFDTADFSVFLSCSYKSSGTATIGADSYKYEDYYNAMAQHTRRFFFDQSGTLVYMTTLDSDGNQGALSTVTLYSATESVFDILKSYKLVDLSGQTTGNSTSNTSNVQ